MMRSIILKNMQSFFLLLSLIRIIIPFALAENSESENSINSDRAAVTSSKQYHQTLSYRALVAQGQVTNGSNVNAINSKVNLLKTSNSRSKSTGSNMLRSESNSLSDSESESSRVTDSSVDLSNSMVSMSPSQQSLAELSNKVNQTQTQGQIETATINSDQPVEALERWIDTSSSSDSGNSNSASGGASNHSGNTNSIFTSALDHDLQELHISDETVDDYRNEFVKFVTNTTTRFIGTEGNSQAQNYIKKKFESYGLTVSVQPFHVNSVQCNNIVGTLQGTNPALPEIIVGAHYDDLPAGETAPGADDNGSGVVDMLMIAKKLTTYLNAKRANQNGKGERTVKFVAFSAEEQGLHGSKAFVDAEKASNAQIFQTLILDEVSYKQNRNAKSALIFETMDDNEVHNAPQQHLINTLGQAAISVGTVTSTSTSKSTPKAIAAAAVTSLSEKERKQKIYDSNSNSELESDSGSSATYTSTPKFNLSVNYAGFGSDHIPFLENGYPAVLLIERDNLAYADAFGHTVNDKLENVDFDYAQSINQVAFKAVLGLVLEGSGSSNNSNNSGPGPQSLILSKNDSDSKNKFLEKTIRLHDTMSSEAEIVVPADSD